LLPCQRLVPRRLWLTGCVVAPCAGFSISRRRCPALRMYVAASRHRETGSGAPIRCQPAVAYLSPSCCRRRHYIPSYTQCPTCDLDSERCRQRRRRNGKRGGSQLPVNRQPGAVRPPQPRGHANLADAPTSLIWCCFTPPWSMGIAKFQETAILIYKNRTAGYPLCFAPRLTTGMPESSGLRDRCAMLLVSRINSQSSSAATKGGQTLHQRGTNKILRVITV
jgi:hypothetical protein